MLGAEREDALVVVGIARLDQCVGRRLLALGAAFAPVAMAVFARTNGMRSWVDADTRDPRVAGAAALAAGDEAGHRLHSLLRHAYT